MSGPKARITAGATDYLLAVDLSHSPAETVRQKCERLRALHRPGDPLILPNAWDVASALAVVNAGFPVVATTSGGVAATLGYGDHEQAPAIEMFAGAKRIARSVEVPVTIDAEAGYGLAPADLIDALLDAGAAGCNLEDTDHKTAALADVGVHSKWLAAVREEAQSRNYALVINARVDVFLPQHLAGSPAEANLEQGILRARAYVAAGADCLYPILLSVAQVIEAFTKAVKHPVYILALPSAPSLAQLAAFGVARISYGSILHHRSMDHLSTLLRQVSDTGQLSVASS